MKWFLYLCSALTLFAGFYDLGIAQSAIHQVVGLLWLVIAAILFCTTAILNKLNELTETNKTQDKELS